jgi:hypothetical protein
MIFSANKLPESGLNPEQGFYPAFFYRLVHKCRCSVFGINNTKELKKNNE